MDTSLVTFRKYKSDYSFALPTENYFQYDELYGCNESEFEKWLRKQRLFIKRFSQPNVPLEKVRLPINKWGFFIKHYKKETRTNFLVSTFPDGFFEAINDDGLVAAFLPDTYGQAPYRISYYRDNGPVYHEAFNTRTDALVKLARSNFKAEEGVLDNLLNTERWDRGLIVAIWLSEGIHPMEGLKRDKDLPEIQKLFAAELSA